MRFGVHCSIRNGMVNALEEARSLGCGTMQIFTRSPRIWKARALEEEEAVRFRKKRAEYGIFPLVIHVPYLPNLATSDKGLYARSADILADDIVIASRIGGDYVIVHPGSYSMGSSMEEGLSRIAAAAGRALQKAAGRVTLLFENVSGEGRKIGSRFEELKFLVENAGNACNAGICLDTAHLFAAGYDISDAKNVRAVLGEFDRVVGRKWLKAVHLNDSRYGRGTKRDRHEHIGAGLIGRRGIRAFLRHSFMKDLPVILETPKDSPSDDIKNLALARSLAGYREA